MSAILYSVIVAILGAILGAVICSKYYEDWGRDRLVSQVISDPLEYKRLRISYLRKESEKLILKAEKARNLADKYDASSDSDQMLAEEYKKELLQLEGK